MRISRLIGILMLSVTALAGILGATALVPQYRTFTGKTEAIKAVEAFGAVLAVEQQIAGHRAPYVGALFQDAAATPAQVDAITKVAQLADKAFADALTQVSVLRDNSTAIESLSKAAAKLADIRLAMNRAIAVPISGRDALVIKGFLPAIIQVVAIVEPLLDRLENEVATADASQTALLGIARTAQDLRVTAGGRAATITFPLSTRRPLTADEISSLDRAQGRIDADRQRIESGVDQIGSPARIASAMRGALEAYYGRAAPMIDNVARAGRNDGQYTISSDELAATVLPAVQSFLALRDAALAEAAERANAARYNAFVALVMAGAAVVSLLGVLAGVTVMLRRRVINPLVAFVGVVGDLAAGRHEVVVPGADRTDEIGSMAVSLKIFKDVLVAKKLADELAAADADSKIQHGQRVDRITHEFETVIGEIVNTVSSASTELEGSAGSLSSTAERSQKLTTMVSTASEEASTNVQSVASATEEMASSVNEISRQVQDSARIASEAVEQARKTNARVGELAKAAARIGDVVELINTIAGQTNLLALNATIEAARAGEAGRGFAVVASEVKALAEQTARATGEIGQQINGIQAATQESVGAIKEIGDTISRMSEIASAIASAVEEQGAATQEIARNVQQAAQGTHQVSSHIVDVQRGATETGAEAAQVLSAARSLSGESSRLRQEVAKFLHDVRAA